MKVLVRDYLSSKSAGQWLLVFDNPDTIDMWVGTSTSESGRLIDCLPKSGHGSIIFTTRDHKAAFKLAGRNIVEVSEMDEAGRTQLLGKYLADKKLLENREDTTALVAQLTYLPLAIVQAAAYINASRTSLADYLSLLDEKEEGVIDLLSEEFEDEGRYSDIKNPVAVLGLSLSSKFVIVTH